MFIPQYNNWGMHENPYIEFQAGQWFWNSLNCSGFFLVNLNLTGAGCHFQNWGESMAYLNITAQYPATTRKAYRKKAFVYQGLIFFVMIPANEKLTYNWGGGGGGWDKKITGGEP